MYEVGEVLRLRKKHACGGILGSANQVLTCGAVRDLWAVSVA